MAIRIFSLLDGIPHHSPTVKETGDSKHQHLRCFLCLIAKIVQGTSVDDALRSQKPQHFLNVIGRICRSLPPRSDCCITGTWQ